MTTAHRSGTLAPGERTARMIRVNHAGEYGAQRIYAGQLAVLGRSAVAPVLREMKAQEERHLETFERMIVERRIRPTALYPVWTVAGFALGAGTALLGRRAAMACTIAVEEVIDGHYAAQLAELDGEEEELREAVERFRAEECEHRDQARDLGGERAAGYPVLRRAIQAGSRAAIWLSERF